MKIKYALQRCELCKFIEDNFKIDPKHEIDSIVFKYGQTTVLVDEMEIICVKKESCDIETVKDGGVPRVDAFPDRHVFDRIQHNSIPFIEIPYSLIE